MISKKYIYNHKNPFRKLDLNRRKTILPTSIVQENTLLEQNLDILKRALTYDRVERRCARAKAVLLQDKNLLKIIKSKHSVSHNKLLHFEEALFLLETNKLEVFKNNISLSVQEAFKIFLGNTFREFFKYKTLKMLTLQGYKISRRKLNQVSRKRRFQNVEVEASEQQTNSNRLFKRLRENGPKAYGEYDNSNNSKNPDYYVVSPKRHQDEFKLFVISGNYFPDYSFKEQLNSDLLLIFAIASDSNLAFYRFIPSNIPTLL